MPEPVRIGILNDVTGSPPGSFEQNKWLQLAVDELRASGRLDRELELVHSHRLGLPSGTAAAVSHAYTELVDQDVLLIVGPAIGDNALVATPLAEQYRVPTINWAGTERARSHYMFQLQVGSHEDEGSVIARHLAAIGARRLAIVHDRSPIGRRYLSFVQGEAEVLGLSIVGLSSLAPLTEDATDAVDALVRTAPDALVYLGLGRTAPAVAHAITAVGWDGPRMMNTSGLFGYQPDVARAIDGWTYLDMHADDNTTLRALRQRIHDPDAGGYRPAVSYDVGRLIAESVARAPELTRDGLRDGLERVKWLPAAQGHEGTLLGFGHHDHGALHGRYLVVRQWRDGITRQVETSAAAASFPQAPPG